MLPFVVMLFLFALLSWRIIRPMGGPLMWSIVLSYLAYPFYKFLYFRVFKERYANIAAAFTTTAILFLLLIPMLFFGLFLTREAVRISGAVVSSGLLHGSYAEILVRLNELPVIGQLMDWMDLMSGFPMLESIVNGTTSWATRFVTRLSTEILGNAFKIFYMLMVVTVSSFFIVRDGHIIIGYIRDILPLHDATKERIIERAARMLRAVVYGIIFTAAVQGTLGGLGWRYVGLANPVFFGFCMFIGGMIPFVGTPVVWIPGSIALLMRGDTFSSLLLLAWGFGVVSTVDNFIRPIFISEGSSIHILVIFIGIFGGLYNWGFLGLFIGPLILSLSIFILDVYRAIVTEKEILDVKIEEETEI